MERAWTEVSAGGMLGCWRRLAEARLRLVVSRIRRRWTIRVRGLQRSSAEHSHRVIQSPGGCGSRRSRRAVDGPRQAARSRHAGDERGTVAAAPRGRWQFMSYLLTYTSTEPLRLAFGAETKLSSAIAARAEPPRNSRLRQIHLRNAHRPSLSMRARPDSVLAGQGCSGRSPTRRAGLSSSASAMGMRPERARRAARYPRRGHAARAGARAKRPYPHGIRPVAYVAVASTPALRLLDQWIAQRPLPVAAPSARQLSPCAHCQRDQVPPSRATRSRFRQSADGVVEVTRQVL